MNLRPITIKTNPHISAIEPLIFLAKNIIVSDNPTRTYNPIIKRRFDNINKALSRNKRIPIIYKHPEIARTTVPNSIFNML